MLFIKKLLFQILFIICFLVSYSCICRAEQPDSSKNTGLLWNAFAESISSFTKINDYTCVIKQDGNSELGENTFPATQITYLKPDQFMLSLKENDGDIKEFIYIEGDTHRVFMYPKEYKISSDGAFLYKKQAISIPDSSLDFFYKKIIPLCKSNKSTLKWEFNGKKTSEDKSISEFSLSFSKPVKINGANINKMLIALNNDSSIPSYVTLLNGSILINSINFDNLVLNTGLKPDFFDKKIETKRKHKDIIIKELAIDENSLNDKANLEAFTLNLFKRSVEKYSGIYDYKALFTRQERINNILQKPENFFIKFRKPFDIYMRWLDEPRTGWEMIYSSGKNNNKVVVHVTGLANVFIPTLELDPTGSLAMLNNRHSILEFGLGYIIEKYSRELNLAAKKNELTLKYIGEDKVDGRQCWVIETLTPPGKKYYYCYRSILYMDKEYFIPTKTLFYQWNKDKKQSELIESYEFHQMSFNNGFTDYDFDRKNKEYKF